VLTQASEQRLWVDNPLVRFHSPCQANSGSLRDDWRLTMTMQTDPNCCIKESGGQTGRKEVICQQPSAEWRRARVDPLYLSLTLEQQIYRMPLKAQQRITRIYRGKSTRRPSPQTVLREDKKPCEKKKKIHIFQEKSIKIIYPWLTIQEIEHIFLWLYGEDLQFRDYPLF
jgi:hypothetical protein